MQLIQIKRLILIIKIELKSGLEEIAVFTKILWIITYFQITKKI